MHAQTQLTGAIITAGGRARRFGSDKVLARLGGQTLLEWVAASLPSAQTRLIVSSNPAHTLPGWRTIPDRRTGALGPLCGLETGLSAVTQAGWVAFCAADMPRLSQAYWALLLAQVTPQAGAVVGRDVAFRLQPLAALYHTRVLPLVTEQLEAGQLSMNGLLLRLECQVVPVPQQYSGALLNVNTLADWRELGQSVSGSEQ